MQKTETTQTRPRSTRVIARSPTITQPTLVTRRCLPNHHHCPIPRRSSSRLVRLLNAALRKIDANSAPGRACSPRSCRCGNQTGDRQRAPFAIIWVTKTVGSGLGRNQLWLRQGGYDRSLFRNQHRVLPMRRQLAVLGDDGPTVLENACFCGSKVEHGLDCDRHPRL